jgi:hypothetical protein
MMRELEVQTGNFGEGDAMSTEGTAKSKESAETEAAKTETAENKVAENLESEAEVRDEGRREDDRAEQQDLNQGMDTGTHESTRYGVNWPASYRNLSKSMPDKPKEVPENTDDKPDKSD